MVDIFSPADAATPRQQRHWNPTTTAVLQPYAYATAVLKPQAHNGAATPRSQRRCNPTPTAAQQPHTHSGAGWWLVDGQDGFNLELESSLACRRVRGADIVIASKLDDSSPGSRVRVHLDHVLQYVTSKAPKLSLLEHGKIEFRSFYCDYSPNGAIPIPGKTT